MLIGNIVGPLMGWKVKFVTVIINMGLEQVLYRLSDMLEMSIVQISSYC